MTRSAPQSHGQPDFLDTAEDDDAPITETMNQILVTAENGVAIGHYLGRNPEEAARIAALPPLLQAFELGFLCAAVAVPLMSRRH